MSSDPLIERYVADVARRLPAGQRQDVAAELRASILDSAEDRTATDDTGREAAVRAVLTDLGDPAALAREYDPEGRWLIGPDQYDDWWTALRGLVLAVAPVVAAITVVADLWAGESVLDVLVDGAWAFLTVAVHVCFWVTLTFWILHRTGGASGTAAAAWSPDDLPEAPRRRTIGLSELIWGVGVVTVSLGWLAWQHLRSPIHGIAMLDPALWSSGWLWGLVALLLVALAVEIVKYAVGTWTLTVTVMSVLVDLMLGGYLVAMATTQRLVNPELLALASDPAATETLVQSAVVLSVVVVTAIGVGDAVVHHGRDRRDAGLATVAG